MSQASNQMVKSFIAGVTFASKQYFAVQMDTTANTVKVAGGGAAEGAHVVGVIQNEPGSGEAASVAIGGTSKLSMAAACDEGEKIMSDGNGEGTPVTTDTYSVIGIALEASDGNGSIIEVLLTPGGVGQADESN